MSNLMVRLHIALFAAMGILISLLVLPLPGNDVSYMADPALHVEIRQGIWWACSFVTFIWLIRTTTGNLIGTIACTIFGPVTLLTMGLMKISYMVFPHKKVKKNV